MFMTPYHYMLSTAMLIVMCRYCYLSFLLQFIIAAVQMHTAYCSVLYRINMNATKLCNQSCTRPLVSSCENERLIALHRHSEMTFTGCLCRRRLSIQTLQVPASDCSTVPSRAVRASHNHCQSSSLALSCLGWGWSSTHAQTVAYTWHNRTPWRRPRGRPRHTWMRQLEEDTGLIADNLWSIASDREAWTALRPIAGQAVQWVSECLWWDQFW